MSTVIDCNTNITEAWSSRKGNEDALSYTLEYCESAATMWLNWAPPFEIASGFCMRYVELLPELFLHKGLTHVAVRNSPWAMIPLKPNELKRELSVKA